MNKPNLIIIPGWGGTLQTWLDFSNLAERYFEVKCIELPCFGNEPCPNSVWGIEEYAEFIKKQISKLRTQNSEPIILLGHSFGGQVATFLSSKNPELIDKLILSGAPIFRPKKSLKRSMLYILAKIGKLIFSLPLLNRLDTAMKKILYRTARSPDYTNTSGIKKEIYKKIIREDLSDLLPNIKTSTSVIWGEKDNYVPLKQGKMIAKLIPNSSLEIVEGGRHGLHMHNREELLNAIIKTTA